MPIPTHSKADGLEREFSLKGPTVLKAETDLIPLSSSGWITSGTPTVFHTGIVSPRFAGAKILRMLLVGYVGGTCVFGAKGFKLQTPKAAAITADATSLGYVHLNADLDDTATLDIAATTTSITVGEVVEYIDVAALPWTTYGGVANTYLKVGDYELIAYQHLSLNIAYSTLATSLSVTPYLEVKRSVL